ncbi:MAG: hypothetical protein ABSG59_16880 [Verrucomicrobiota bacterium]
MNEMNAANGGRLKFKGKIDRASVPKAAVRVATAAAGKRRGKLGSSFCLPFLLPSSPFCGWVPLGKLTEYPSKLRPMRSYAYVLIAPSG